jgi:adenosylcobinamide-GDP ribazoletransferase
MNPLAELRYFFTALGYFTRVPVPRWVGYEPHYLNAAARYFPLVGVLVGGLSALVYLVALRVFPAGVAVLLSMAASLLVTGAFHEDGLADCIDAFGGAYTREDVLRIMHDSRIGAFGAIALVMALALKWQTLAALPPMRAAGLMIAAHAASRTCAISYLATLDYVRAEGKAKPVAQRLSAGAFICAALSGLPWLLWPNGPGAPEWRFAGSVVAVLLVLRVAVGRYFVRRIGGYTGDCLGFAQQVFELSIYLVGLAWISS